MRLHNRSVLSALLALGLLLSACRPPAAAPTPPPTSLPATPPSARSTTTAVPGTQILAPTTGVGVATAAATSVPARQQTPQPSLPTPTLAPGQVRSVTLNDNGKTITMKAGERFLLNLGEGLDWTVEIADGSVLNRVLDVLTRQGSQGMYEARKAGTTTLTATGDPPCRKVQPPCMAPSLLFQITVVVQ